MDPKLDKIGGNLQTKKNSRETLQRLIAQFDVTDIFRYKNPNKRRYTWYQRNPAIKCRLDYFLVSDSLVSYCEKIDIINGFKSDHNAIVFDIKPKYYKHRGPGLWIFNNMLLKDNEYCELVRSLITQAARETENKDEAQVWEYIKYKIRWETIKYSKRKNRHEKE